METLKEKVDRFKEYYLDLISVAESEHNLANQKVHSKILCCSVFDAISKSVFPNAKSNRERFTSLVRLCKNWPESQKISVLHLMRLFEVTPHLSPEAKELRELVSSKYNKLFTPSNHPMSNSIPISTDLDLEEVLKLWPKENSKQVKIGNVLPHQLKHEHLLWLYRNSVVHEYRNPGNGVELGQYVPEYAFYQEVFTNHTIEDTRMKFTNHWELVYPSKLFSNLCKNAVDIACAFHLKNSSCPFKAYSDGTYWIPDFNE